MDELTSSEEEPTTDRCDPSGASNDSEEISNPTQKHSECCEHCHCVYASEKFEEKLQNLEEEHEMLNSSLCALTTHFAQVQFRLRQAVAASDEDKDALLKSLEEFAFRGIPDVGVVRERLDEARLTETVWLRRVQQQQLIEKLKSHLKELEHMCKSGETGVLQESELENQRSILQELKLRMNVELDEQGCCWFTPGHVKKETDIVDQLGTPLKTKERLVTQLKTQIADLERFINYLQANNKNPTSCACYAIHSVKKPLKTADTMGTVKRAAALLHMFATVYLGCSPQQYNKRNLNHWGDLRAKLEMAIAKVLEAIEASANDKSLPQQGDYNSDNEFSSAVSNVQVTMVVRKHLAVSIRDLMQHGACQGASIYKLVPFLECFKQKFKVSDTAVHAWEIILHYYHLKNGERFNSTPVRKLSQSFNLDIAGVCSKSNRHTMLSEIGNILSTHAVYKQSFDSHFKAFICAGLNANKLVAWLGLIFECRSLVDMHYHSWSYAMKTGFSDSLQSLDALTDLQFDLPADLAIRRFQNMQDVFI